jgi:hypothetical protein
MREQVREQVQEAARPLAVTEEWTLPEQNMVSTYLANNVVACMGAITGVIGSLVGAYFGVQLGNAGKEAADATAAKQSALASAAMGQIEDPDKSTAAIENAQNILQTPSP